MAYHQLARPLALIQQDLLGLQERYGILVEQFGNRAPQGFCRGKAIHGFGASIPIEDAVFQVAHDNGVAGLVEQRGLLFQSKLSGLALGKIGHVAGHAQRLAVGVAHQVGAVEHIGIAAVVTTKAIFAAPAVAALRQSLVEAGHHRLAIVRVQRRQPEGPACVELLATVAKEPLQTLAPPHFVVHQVPVPQRILTGPSQRLKTLLAGQQLLALTSPLGDVEEMDGQPLFKGNDAHVQPAIVNRIIFFQLGGPAGFAGPPIFVFKEGAAGSRINFPQ